MDRELLTTLIEVFLQDGPSYLAQRRSDLKAADRVALARCAHTIKSPLGTLGLDLALADELESLGKQRKLDKAATITDRLARELERVISQLTSWTTAIPEETAS